METEEKPKSRQQQLNELDKLIAKHKADAEEFGNQEAKLRQSLADEEKVLAGRVNEVLDCVPDKSSKGLVEDVLKIPIGKSRQLRENISKMEIAKKSAKQKAVFYSGAKAKILAEIKEDETNQLTRQAFAELERTVELIKAVENQFYGQAVPAIEKAYESDMKFHDVNGRAMELGLNPVISHVIDSQIRQGETGSVTLDDFIEAIRDIGDYYGKGTKLLDKIYRSSFREHPATDSSYFGFEQSNK